MSINFIRQELKEPEAQRETAVSKEQQPEAAPAPDAIVPFYVQPALAVYCVRGDNIEMAMRQNPTPQTAPGQRPIFLNAGPRGDLTEIDKEEPKVLLEEVKKATMERIGSNKIASTPIHRAFWADLIPPQNGIRMKYVQNWNNRRTMASEGARGRMAEVIARERDFDMGWNGPLAILTDAHYKLRKMRLFFALPPNARLHHLLEPAIGKEIPSDFKRNAPGFSLDTLRSLDPDLPPSTAFTGGQVCLERLELVDFTTDFKHPLELALTSTAVYTPTGKAEDARVVDREIVGTEKLPPKLISSVGAAATGGTTHRVVVHRSIYPEHMSQEAKTFAATDPLVLANPWFSRALFQNLHALRTQVNELPEHSSPEGFVTYVKNNIPHDICDTDDLLFLIIAAHIAYLDADAVSKGWNKNTQGKPIVLDVFEGKTVFNMTLRASRDTLLRLINELDAISQQANVVLNLSHLRLHVQVPESHVSAHQDFRASMQQMRDSFDSNPQVNFTATVDLYYRVIDWQNPAVLSALNTRVVTEFDKLQAPMYPAHVDKKDMLSGYSISTSFFGNESPFFVQREVARQEVADQAREQDKQSAFMAAAGISDAVDEKENDTAAFWETQIAKEKSDFFAAAVSKGLKGEAIKNEVFAKLTEKFYEAGKANAKSNEYKARLAALSSSI